MSESESPIADIYERLLADTGAPAGRLLFVDDRKGNVARAAALGIPAVQFTGPRDYIAPERKTPRISEPRV